MSTVIADFVPPVPKLYIRLKAGRRLYFAAWKAQGVVRAHFAGSDGWDWYHVTFDSSPELMHQIRRDVMSPLKKDDRPVYGPVPKIEGLPAHLNPEAGR